MYGILKNLPSFLRIYGMVAFPSDINVTSPDADIAAVLMASVDNIGSPTVKSTDDSTCANRFIDVSFVDKAGDQELMTVSSYLC